MDCTIILHDAFNKQHIMQFLDKIYKSHTMYIIDINDIIYGINLISRVQNLSFNISIKEFEVVFADVIIENYTELSLLHEFLFQPYVIQTKIYSSHIIISYDSKNEIIQTLQLLRIGDEYTIWIRCNAEAWNYDILNICLGG